MIADTGFRPEKDGFSFENYGQAPPGAAARPDLTADDVRKLFGDAVCVDAARGKCDLTPPARVWMTSINKSISGGHCFGFSVASELLFQGKDKASSYGGDSTPALKIDDNPPLARQLAYTWAFQTLDKVRSSVVEGTPEGILTKLQAALIPNPQETYTVALFKRDGSGGHAVTPYAIEDHGDGTYSVLIYDNNWPGVTRQITIDKNANTWNYVAATNPKEPSEVYEGDTKTASLSLFPTSPGTGTQPCPFCGKVPTDSGPPAGSTGATGAGGKPEMDLIYLDGSDTDHGHLLITDSAGHQLGYVDGNLVNTIPGASIAKNLSAKNWLDAIEPDYYVPDGGTYTITLDGTGITETDPTSIGIIASSFDMSANDIQLEPGQKDTLVVGPSATTLSYTSNRAASPSLEVGVSDKAADYVFDLTTQGVSAGGTLNLGVPLDGSGLKINTVGSSSDAHINLTLNRTDDQEQRDFAHNNVTLAAADSALLQYGTWANTTDGIPLLTTHDGHTSTETLTNTH